MKTLLLFAVWSTSIFVFGQEVERTLNGPVKEVLEKTYAPGDQPKFSRQKRSFYAEDGTLLSSFVFQKEQEGDFSLEIADPEEHANDELFSTVYRNDYDSTGNLIRRFRNERVAANDRLYLHFPDEKGNDTLIEIWDLSQNLVESLQFDYDDKGNCVAWKGFHEQKEITTTVGKASYVYYPNGMVKEKVLDSVTYQKAFPFTTFRYSEEGELVEEFHLNDAQEKVYHFKTEFKEGKKLRAIQYKKGIQDVVYTYNSEGQEVSMAKYKVGMVEPVFTRRYEYNEEGNVVYMSMTQSQGNIKVEWGFDYKYDKHDNWTERLETEGDRAFRLSRREIKYYRR